jgi:hypothetical protein
MIHPKLWGTTDTRNGLPTTTKESPDFSHGECQVTIKTYLSSSINTHNIFHLPSSTFYHNAEGRDKHRKEVGHIEKNSSSI